MQRDEYRAITKTQLGSDLRNIMRNGCSKQPPRISELREQLTKIGVTEPARQDEIVDKIKKLSERARNGESPMSLSESADLEAVGYYRQAESEDSLHGEHGLSSGDDDVDAGDVADTVRGRTRGLTDEQIAEEKQNEAERQRLRKVGVNVDG